MEIPTTVGIIGLLLAGLVGLMIVSAQIRSSMSNMLSSVLQLGSTQQAAPPTTVIQQRCPYCAAAMRTDGGRCDECHQEIASAASANEERDAALNSLDSARQLMMVKKLATFKALSDADIDALLQLNSSSELSDLQMEAQAALMGYFNITVDDTYYRYQTYRYDRFENAVAYARHDMAKARRLDA